MRFHCPFLPLLKNRLLPKVNKMSKTVASNGVFVQSLNPMTGQDSWNLQPENYDYQQEVARAAFADMLHDTERNKMYYSALRKAIGNIRAKGQEVHVLDIGTGTGLLSMMAATIGVDSITAVEEFRPIAECAEKVIRENGFADQIKIVRKRSTDVTVGQDADMVRKANILVTEVFDTELIGEGAIGTFNHAHQELLTDDCIVVPDSGTIHVQLISSDVASRWHKLKEIEVGEKTLKPSEDSANTSNSLALHDLQLTQFKQDWFVPLSDPIPVFRFDFSSQGKKIPLNRQSVIDIKSLNSGSCDAVLMWWDLDMDTEKEIKLSCAPKWAHPSPSNMAWRDHWMQAIYYSLSEIVLTKDESIAIVSNHDEYSFWFDVRSQFSENEIIPMPMPSHGIHLAVSRQRLGQINDVSRNIKLAGALEKAISMLEGPKICLAISEMSLLPLMAAMSGADKVLVYEKNPQMRSVLQEMAAHNKLESKMEIFDQHIIDLDSPEKIPIQPNLLIGEPNFSLNLLPWHNLLYWFICDKLKMKNAQTFIQQAELWGVPVEFEDLWKIRSPLHQVEGFSMRQFDNIIMKAIEISDGNVEPHPLWEYPCKALGQPNLLMTFDITKALPDENLCSHTQTKLEACPNAINGFVLWMKWHHIGNISTSSGPIEDVQVGQYIHWDLHSKQGVHFFLPSCKIDSAVSMVDCKVCFKPGEGDLTFGFQLK